MPRQNTRATLCQRRQTSWLPTCKIEEWSGAPNSPSGSRRTPSKARNQVFAWGIPLGLGLREIEGAASGQVRPQHTRRLHGGAPKGRRAREKYPERSHGQVPKILPGSRENTPRADLGQVIGGLFLPDDDTIPNASKILTNRFQPLRILEKGPNAFQDHEARAEHLRSTSGCGGK